MSGVALVQMSFLDTKRFIPLCRQALNRCVSEGADSIDSNPPLHHLLCIAGMNEPNLKPSAKSCIPYANLFHAGFLIVMDERDSAEIIAICGMPSTLVESVERGFCTAFIAGTLDQWKAACLRGCVKDASREARHTFNLIYGEFNKLGLSQIFEARKVERPDNTFLLEYRP